MKMFDITPEVSSRTPVWPGDTPFTRTWNLQLEQGHTVNLSEIRATVHLGAHADAPLHYQSGGRDIAAMPLELYFGPALVWEVPDPPARGGMPAAWFEGLDGARLERLLIKTRRTPCPGKFDEQFPFLTEGAGAALAQCGLKLVGLDVPSVDAFDSSTLRNHHAFAAAGMAHLEGLELSHVEPGEYELIALPLRLNGADASPVRAVLISRQA